MTKIFSRIILFVAVFSIICPTVLANDRGFEDEPFNSRVNRVVHGYQPQEEIVLGGDGNNIIVRERPRSVIDGIVRLFAVAVVVELVDWMLADAAPRNGERRAFRLLRILLFVDPQA